MATTRRRPNFLMTRAESRKFALIFDAMIRHHGGYIEGRQKDVWTSGGLTFYPDWTLDTRLGKLTIGLGEGATCVYCRFADAQGAKSGCRWPVSVPSGKCNFHFGKVPANEAADEIRRFLDHVMLG